MDVVLELISKGGVIAVLTAIVLAFFTGRVVTKAAQDIIVKFWQDRYEAQTHDKDEWKALAKSMVPVVERLADALEVRNRLDEERRAKS